MKHLNDPFEQLERYKKTRKRFKKKNKEEVRVYLPKNLKPIICGKEKIKFTKILNYKKNED